MSSVTSLLARQLGELHREFDQGFAAPVNRRVEEPGKVIAIRAAGKTFALKAEHVAALAPNEKLAPVPSRAPELLGIAAIRGALVAVYDLAALLGIPGRRAPARWLAIPRGGSFALAFDELGGWFGVAREDFYPGDAGSQSREAVRIGSAVCPVVDPAALAEAIKQRAGPRDRLRSELP